MRLLSTSLGILLLCLALTGCGGSAGGGSGGSEDTALPPEAPQVSGVTDGRIYMGAVTIQAVATAGVQLAATIDGESYTLGSSYNITGNHLLIVAAVDPDTALQATTQVNFIIREFMVSPTPNSVNENYCEAGSNSNGRVVSVWAEREEATGYYDVYGKIFEANGRSVGDAFLVNEETFHFQYDPDVAVFENGGFVVVWESCEQDKDSFGIYGQRYSSSGTKAGGEFRINTTTVGGQMYPAVAAQSDGAFLVVWVSNGDVYGQRFSVQGTPIGSEFVINTTTFNTQSSPAIAATEDDGFVVCWQSNASGIGEDDIVFQLLDNSGSKVGGEVTANTFTAQHQTIPAVATLASGGFVITWASWLVDGSSHGVAARIFNAAGTPAGDEFLVNTVVNSSQNYPDICSLPDGSFVIIWEKYDPNTAESDICARRFASDGSLVTDEHEVNVYKNYSQEKPSITAIGDNRYFVQWYHDDLSIPLRQIFATIEDEN